jgi:hypothetical protein
MANTYIKEFEDWLLMGSWHVDTACKILAGFFPTIIEAGVYSYSADQLQQISNGKAPTDAQQKEYRRIYALFKSDQHNWAANGADGKSLFPQSNLNIMESTVRPCYAIDWAASKRIQPAWLDEARKEGFPVDMLQSEPVKEKPESPKELTNRMRLIGVLADMLKDENIAHENKKNADAIATYIADNYAPGVGNKGIGKDTVEKILGKAKALLEDEEIIQKPKK